MEDFLQKPEAKDAPTSKSEAPWQKRIQYRSGKTPEGFATAAEPEQVKAGFTFYDREQKANFAITGFTASIVGILSGVSGTVPNGTRYDNYWSSLVQDTRDQKLAVFLGSGDNRVTVASGIYNDFKAGLPDGVSYMKYAVVYLHETNECALIELTAAVENSIKEAIAAQTGQNAARINIFNLFELTTKFWAVRFKGEYSKRNREGAPWPGKGDMFFYPSLVAGVVASDAFPILPELAEKIDQYIKQGQKYFNGTQPAPPVTQSEQAARVDYIEHPSALPFAAPVKAPAMEGGWPTQAPPETDDESLPF